MDCNEMRIIQQVQGSLANKSHPLRNNLNICLDSLVQRFNERLPTLAIFDKLVQCVCTLMLDANNDVRTHAKKVFALLQTHVPASQVQTVMSKVMNV